MEELIGKKVENYSIISILGKGGMGVVYKAHDDNLDRIVAIKILNFEAFQKPRFRERFRREAKHQAQLSHPNIVTVYGFIEYKGLVGIVMEYVEGESLEKVIYKQKRLHVYDVIYILRQVLHAIGYAHSRGFVHRDLKPSNIILNREGTVKIMDFGISKSLFEKTITKTGAQIGTVYYMSPEQINGNEVDQATDIYAIGCTMYEMICGIPPYNYDTEYKVMDAHLNEDVPRIKDSIKGLPESVDVIIAKCLRKNPYDRYRHCEEILDSFNTLDEHLNSAGARYFIRRKKDPKRAKAFSVLSTSIIIVIFLALIYFVYAQVGELLSSGTLDKFEKYDIASVYSSGSKIDFKNIKIINSDTRLNLNSIYFADDNTGVAVGDSSKVIMTTDSGKTWSPVDIIESGKLNDVYFSEDGNVYIVGENSTFLVSNNYFENFFNMNLEKGLNLHRIIFTDEYTGYVLGSDGLILRSADGGKSWQRLVTNTESALFDLSFINDKTGFAVGMKGEILRTDDMGQSWYEQEKFTDSYLKSVDFINEDLGIIVGGRHSIFRTEDGGLSWTNVGDNRSGGLNHVKFIDENNVVVVGSKGTILISTDSGENWLKVNSNLFDNLNRMSVLKNGTIFISGIGGIIIKLY